MSNYWYVAIEGCLPEPRTSFKTKKEAEDRMVELMSEQVSRTLRPIREAYVFNRPKPRMSASELRKKALVARDAHYAQLTRVNAAEKLLVAELHRYLYGHEHDERFRRCVVKVSTEGWRECGCGYRFPTAGYDWEMYEIQAAQDKIEAGELVYWWQGHLEPSEWSTPMKTL